MLTANWQQALGSVQIANLSERLDNTWTPEVHKSNSKNIQRRKRERMSQKKKPWHTRKGKKKNERMETRRKPKKKIHIFSFNPQPTLCCCVLRLVLLDRWSFVMLVWGVEVSYEGRLLVWLRWDRTIRILVFSIETNVQMSLRCGPCGPCGRHANETR